MKRITTILLLLCVVLMANALDKRQTKINSIKKSKEYLYSDITMSTQEGAVSQAFDVLQQNILNWAKDRADKKSGSAVSPKDINKLIDTIMVRRAEMYRVFAYVKKVKLIPLFSDWSLVLTDDQDCDDGNVQDDLAEIEEPKPTEEVKAEKEPEPQTEQPQKEQKDTLANEQIRTLLKNNFLGRKGGVIEQIKKAKNFFELKQIMEPLKQKGDILDYGKYATAKSPEDCYLIVYDPAGNIKAILDKGDKVRQNLNTGKEDSIKNYRGCGAIWFTLKEK